MLTHNDVIELVRNDELDAEFSAVELRTIRRYAGNIKAAYNAADAQQLSDGRQWYARARAFAVELSRAYGYSVEQMCALIAVTSPSVSWAAQLKYSAPLIEAIIRGDDTLPGPFYGANKEKARRILEGEPVERVVSGEKVSAFFANIYDRHSDVVTVDRHALRVALCEDLSPEECKALLGKSSRTRLMVLAAYHLAAQELGELAYVVQAVTWVVYRGAAN